MAEYCPTRNEKNFHEEIRENQTHFFSSYLAVGKQFGLRRHCDEDDRVVIIPDPSLFQFDDDPESHDGRWRLPTIAECAAHLEILATFNTLRSNVFNSKPINRTMGFASDTRPSQADVDAWQEEKWKKFVDFAVVRFLTWRGCMDERFKAGKMNKAIFKKEEAHRIPIDVLMVWSVFMLNTGLYEMHCSQELIYDLGMPWQAIHESIGNKTEWTWEPTNSRGGAIEDLGLGYDLFQLFETWEFPTEQAKGKEYPGLSEFGFVRQNATLTRCPDENHKKLIDLYVKAFDSVDWRLAIQLEEAVLRQELFWRKMTDNMWIRSPAVDGTLRRAINRYDKFMEIMKRNPRTTIVPTVDIDVVWHTHQCAGGRAYAAQTLSRMGRFVHHNDKLGQEPLVIGYCATRRLYRKQFGLEYRICGCWECELLISEVEKVAHLDPSKVNMTEIIEKVRKEMNYYRAAESIRRFGLELPAPWKKESRPSRGHSHGNINVNIP